MPRTPFSKEKGVSCVALFAALQKIALSLAAGIAKTHFKRNQRRPTSDGSTPVPFTLTLRGNGAARSDPQRDRFEAVFSRALSTEMPK
jgi:hypothetical protein